LNKKGYALSMIDIISYIGTAVFAILILALLGFGKSQLTSNITSSSNILTDDVVLLNMLRAPVTVEGSNMTLSDLIVLWRFNESHYKGALTKEVDSLLKSASFQYQEGNELFEKHYSFFVYERPVTGVASFNAFFEDKESLVVESYLIDDGSVNVKIPISTGESLYVTLNSYRTSYTRGVK
jgi:hypothetical protein